jgi:hypothetical protein
MACSASARTASALGKQRQQGLRGAEGCHAALLNVFLHPRQVAADRRVLPELLFKPVRNQFPHPRENLLLPPAGQVTVRLKRLPVIENGAPYLRQSFARQR